MSWGYTRAPPCILSADAAASRRWPPPHPLLEAGRPHPVFHRARTQSNLMLCTDPLTSGSTAPTLASTSSHEDGRGEEDVLFAFLEMVRGVPFRAGRLGIFLGRRYMEQNRAQNCPQFPSYNSKAIQTREFSPENSKRTIPSLNYDIQTQPDRFDFLG
jgi:hypothetical protein